jgi:hypothetical protein
MNLRMRFECLADFNCTSQRRVNAISKDQRHPVPCGNSDQHALCVRRTDLRGVSYDLIERLESLVLFVEEQFRITDHVHEENVPNLPLKI